jgi:hypothetical protein
MSKSTGNVEQCKGWLSKWTNYIKGYQKRWFVIQNGYLSYYRNQSDAPTACRGSVNLANAFIHTQDSSSFVVSSTGSITYHLKAGSEVERQCWVTALEFAKSKAIMRLESEEDEMQETDKIDVQSTLKLDELRTCGELVTKHGSSLQRTLDELEKADSAGDITSRIKSTNERATLFKIASSAMINACNEYVSLSTSQGTRWQKLLQQ